MATIKVDVIEIMGHQMKRLKGIEKELKDVINIGRLENNDITTTDPVFSDVHGRIYLEKGVFTAHLDYEDFSETGTTIIHWNDDSTCKKVHLRGHEKPVKKKIKQGDWIVITRAMDGGSRLRYGFILVPYVY
ncbi:MAG: FHA domain-containing protein [Nanoarchaeota archaeon]